MGWGKSLERPPAYFASLPPRGTRSTRSKGGRCIVYHYIICCLLLSSHSHDPRAQRIGELGMRSTSELPLGATLVRLW